MKIKPSELITIIFIIFCSCSKSEVDQTKPTVGAITESVYASGVIKAEGQYTVFATVSGVLKRINVKGGDEIDKGQSLFELESDKAALNTQNAQLAYQMSQQSNSYIQDKIAEMKLKVLSAKDKLTLDESIYIRNKNIKNQGGISEVDYERVELAFKNSRASYESTKKQLSQLKAQFKNDQSRSAVNLKLSQDSQRDFNVKSAFSGQLFDILVKEGTLITPQVPLAIIGKADSFVLELEVDENDMVRVNVGQHAFVTMDSYKKEVFEAIIDKIYPIMQERSRTFKIEAHFVSAPSKLYPNLTAEANIVIRTKDNAMTIPKNYLIKEQFVLVNNDEMRKVTIGLSDYQKVEILKGLDANETIYLPK